MREIVEIAMPPIPQMHAIDAIRVRIEMQDQMAWETLISGPVIPGATKAILTMSMKGGRGRYEFALGQHSPIHRVDHSSMVIDSHAKESQAFKMNAMMTAGGPIIAMVRALDSASDVTYRGELRQS